ncbi:MAG: hypothetical protein EOO06_04435 [Chitinophagaceae bacterium]|nr:MAG: hypothetical protein EOO06_04435 [Chitinophagaceae bacterium]
MQGFLRGTIIKPLNFRKFAPGLKMSAARISPATRFLVNSKRFSGSMALETIFEKLQLSNEKNILIQGLPSSVEKHFAKLTFCKSVTPLLRSRRIDFSLVFAVSKKQLTDIVNDVAPAMNDGGKFWVAYPKPAAKIASDLCRDLNWSMISAHGYEPECQVVLDNVWIAMRFKKAALEPKITTRVKKLAVLEA